MFSGGGIYDKIPPASRCLDSEFQSQNMFKTFSFV